MVGSFCKAYNLTFDYALDEISFQNILLYNSILPSYSNSSSEKEDEVIDFDDLDV